MSGIRKNRKNGAVHIPVVSMLVNSMDSLLRLSMWIVPSHHLEEIYVPLLMQPHGRIFAVQREPRAKP